MKLTFILKTTSILALVWLFFSCNKSQNEVDKLTHSQWLLGKWECKLADGILLENWSKVNDSTFSGQSLFLKGKDTIHNESIVLQLVAENLKFQTIIKGQNNNDPIVFTLNNSIENNLLFENLLNDYPQKISYKSISEKQFQLKISGIEEGKNKSENYLFKKMESIQSY